MNRGDWKFLLIPLWILDPPPCWCQDRNAMRLLPPKIGGCRATSTGLFLGDSLCRLSWVNDPHERNRNLTIIVLLQPQISPNQSSFLSSSLHRHQACIVVWQFSLATSDFPILDTSPSKRVHTLSHLSIQTSSLYIHSQQTSDRWHFSSLFIGYCRFQIMLVRSKWLIYLWLNTSYTWCNLIVC